MLHKGRNKEACIKVREAIKQNKGKLNALAGCVTGEEFIQAIKVLTTFAMTHQDEQVDLYKCEEDCSHIFAENCPGKLFVCRDGTKLCPYYIEENK